MVAIIHRFTISSWLYLNYIKQTGKNRKEYQWIGVIGAFKYKNIRSDFIAITEKNEKQYVRLQKSISGTQGVFSPVLMVLLITQQSNVMFKCRNENTFRWKLFQINDTNDTYTNDSDMILMANLYIIYPAFGTHFVFVVFVSWKIEAFNHFTVPLLLVTEWQNIKFRVSKLQTHF